MLPQYKTNICEPLYTLAEAEKIINYNQFKQAQKRRAARWYYFKQKLCGVALITIGIVMPLMLGDATASVLIIPLGFGLIITKQKVMIFRR